MLKKFLAFSLSALICVVFYIVISAYAVISTLTNGMMITELEIANLNNNIVKVSYNTTKMVSNTNNTQNIEYIDLDIKIFGLINVASFPAYKPTSDELIVCGNTVGVLMNTDGVTIVGFSGVTSENGIIYPFKSTDLKVGDRIKTINGFEITKIDDVDNSINGENSTTGAVAYSAYRNEKLITGTVKPVYDIASKMFKLGLWIREDASGIGTLTFINPNNNRFGSLGHGICENGSDEPLSIKSGSLHECEVLGLNKGEKGNTGEIKGLFVPGKNCEGTIDKNNKYGVYGYVNDGSQYITGNKIKIGGRLSVKPGKAKILCCLDGESIKSYDIEIIKTNHQKKSNQKSLVIKVTDKELLKKTGGIIQGMSGSPIIQNEKLVGAVTHVFVNDPTKGFGVYLDWMLNE